jgi:hypothetical protein
MTAPQTTSASYEVGYGKPPRHTQFQKGRSGNPGGRSRKTPATRLRELALREAYRTVIVHEDGHAVPMPAIQAILRSQIEIAASGNVRAQRAILAMIEDIEVSVGDGAYGPVNGDDDDDADLEDDAVNDGDGHAQHADGIGADDEEQQEEQDAAPAHPARRPLRPGSAAARRADTPPPVQRWRQPPSPEPPPPPVVPWRERPSRPESYLRRSRRE